MLLALDENVMNVDMTEQMMNVVPTKDELEKVLEYKKKNFDVARLEAPERLFLVICSVPLLHERLFANLTKISFQFRIGQLKPKVETLRNACKQMKESALWKRMLETVLAVGNFMNGKSGRGNAIGIRLESLLKIGDTKSLKTKQSMLQYIVRMLEKNDVPVLSFAKELNSVQLASRLDLGSLGGEVKVLSDMINKVKGSLTRVPEELNPKDMLRNVLNESSVELYSTLLQGVKSEVQSALLDWAALARVYGEDEKQTTSQEFFGMVVKFMEQFDLARKSVLQERMREQQKEAQKAAKMVLQQREKERVDRAKLMSEANATQNLLKAAAGASSEDVTAANLGARETAMLMEAANKLREQPASPSRRVQTAGQTPTSAMLAQLRSGLRSGASFADKREERKKSIRGKMKDDQLPEWARRKASNDNSLSGSPGSPASGSLSSRRSSLNPSDVPDLIKQVQKKKSITELDPSDTIVL
jgi:hypothetical protein